MMEEIDAVGPWPLPREPVPVRLMNTIWADRSGVHDALERPADLHAWLVATGLRPTPGGAPVTRSDLDLARGIRDALRRLAAAVCGDDRPRAATELSEDAAVDALNAALATLPAPALVRSGAGWQLTGPPPATVPAALAGVAAAGARLVVDPGRPLRACHAPGCVLYFVHDHPRREWCGTTCGNRVRAARHYARHRASGRSAAGP